MASFYICHPLQTITHSQNQQITVVDASSACKVLRKAAIKVHEVPAKLEISKVIRFLENLNIKNQTIPESQLISQESIKLEQSLVQLALNEYGNEDQRLSNIMRINTSQSLNSSMQKNEFPLKSSIYKKLGNSVFHSLKSERPNDENKENCNNIVQNFRWKQVGIKDVMNQGEGNLKVTFKDDSTHKIPDKQKQKEFQLKQANEMLKKTIMNIFQFFHSKQLLDLSSSSNHLQLQEIERLSKILLGNFEKREVKLEFERKKMMQVQSEYLTTLKNISIEQRLLQVSQPKPDQTSIVFTAFGNMDPPVQNQNLSTKVQELVTTSNSEVQQLKKHLQQSQERLRQKQEQIKIYEMLLFIKQQQISSLRVLNSDLENRLNKLTKTDQRPRSTRSSSYKKYFEQLSKNMSSTFS